MNQAEQCMHRRAHMNMAVGHLRAMMEYWQGYTEEFDESSEKVEEFIKWLNEEARGIA